MRVVVTGGGGFLGSHLVEQLQQRGDDPFVARRADYDLTRWDDAERGHAAAISYVLSKGWPKTEGD